MFSCKYSEFLRTPILKNICQRLLLKSFEKLRKESSFTLVNNETLQAKMCLKDILLKVF